MYTIRNFHGGDFSIELDFFDFEIKPRSVVSLEAFFRGNDDNRSYTWFPPELDSNTRFFYEVLKNIRNREDVEAVLVEISGIDIRKIGDKFMFPFSERIYI